MTGVQTCALPICYLEPLNDYFQTDSGKAFYDGFDGIVWKQTTCADGLTETFDSSVLGNIQVNHKKLLSVGGENSLEWITFEDGSKLNIDGLFVALGSAGSTDIAKKLGLILKDNHIMIETDTSTMLPGFFAAGDCTGGMMQIAKAVYEGAQAGTKAVKFIKNTK